MLHQLLSQAGTASGSTITVPDFNGFIVLFHGLHYDRSRFRGEKPFRHLELGLASLGYGVVVSDMTGDGSSQASYLQDQFDLDDTGANVLSDVLTYWETTVSAIQTDYPSLPILAAGISWGGLYALQVAGRASTLPDAVFVHVPATDPNFLTEFTGYGLASLGDFNEAGMTSAPNTPRVPTLISYATDDTRVGYTESETLATTVGADTIVYSSLGHNTTDATNRALFDWLKTISI